MLKQISFFLILGLLGLSSCTSGDGNAETSLLIVEEEIPEVETAYGIPIDSYTIHQGEIRNNQFLADVLLKYHISYPEIDKLVKAAKGVFDARRIVPGDQYTVLSKRDSTGKAAYFIYEPNALEYIVFDLRDSVRVYREEREVTEVEKWAEGEISSSLYESFQSIGVSPVLAMKLSDLYAWSIDFYRIQKGDHFRVMYTERQVEGEAIGIGDVKACLFTHSGEKFYAFEHSIDSISDYYDENGNSLRKAFLKAPLQFSRISSGFSRKRFHPVQKRWKAHLGTDYAAPKGTPILAVGDGKVIAAAYGKYNGRYVKIRHNSTYTTQYLHMSGFAKGVKNGSYVRQGDVIGYVGSTGLATGPHVCFRFWKNGAQVDHRREKLPPSKPIPAEHMESYMAAIELTRKQLEPKKKPMLAAN